MEVAEIKKSHLLVKQWWIFVSEIHFWSHTQGVNFTLGNFCLEMLTKNSTYFDEYKYSGYGIRFDAWLSFSLSDDSGSGKIVIIFGAVMSCGSKVDSAFHPSEVNKMSNRKFWELSGKK